MRCQKCGQEAPDYARFCQACGSALVPEAPTAPPAENTTQHYSQQAPYYAPERPYAQQAPYYAQQEPYDAQQAPHYTQQPGFDGTYPPPAPRRRRAWIPVIISFLVLALLLGVAAVCFLVFRVDESKVAERFVEAVLLNDEEAVARCFHPNMAQNAVREYATVIYGVDSCEAETVKTDLLSRVYIHRAEALFKDYEIDATIDSLWLVTVDFTLTSGGASYDAVAEIYVGRFDGGWYVLGGEPMYRVENP